MNSNSNGIGTVFLAVSVVLLVVGSLHLTTRPDPPAFAVLRSAGTSAVDGGSVLVPDDKIRTGDRVRVGFQPLVATLGSDGRIRARFESGTVFRHRGRPLGAESLHLESDRGGGLLRVDTGTVVFDFGQQTIVLRDGMVRWDLSGSKPRLKYHYGAKLNFLRDGETVPVSRSDLPTASHLERSEWPRSAHPVTNYEQHSLLVSEKQVIEDLVDHSRPGTPATSLLEVYGHWVRDRWGSIYRYTVEDGRLSLRSGGPDERLFTGDDRRWSRPISR